MKPMDRKIFPASLALALALFAHAASPPAQNALFEERFESGTPSATLEGDASIIDFGRLEDETSGKCARLNAATDINHDGRHDGRVAFTVHGLAGSEGQWFRFSFRGLPAKDFTIEPGGELAMRIRFLGSDGHKSYDGLVKDLLPSIEADRKTLEKNGNGFRFGSAV